MMKQCNYNIKKVNGDDYRSSKGSSLGMCNEDTLIFADFNKDKTKVFISQWDISGLKTYDDGHKYGIVQKTWELPDGEKLDTFYAVWVNQINENPKTPDNPSKLDK